MKFIVFGLGNYGAALSTKLVALGHEVIGVDLKMELVEKFKNQITFTIALDAGSLEGVKSLPLKETDVVINAIGEGEGANIMLTALLKQLNANRIICRVISPLHKTVLETMGIQEFVYPEADSAERTAHTLDLKGVVDSYKVSDDYQLIDVAVPERYFDKRIFEVNFPQYEIQLVTIIRTVDEKTIFGTTHKVKKVVGLLSPGLELKKGDRVLLFGEVTKLEDFIEM